MIPSQEAWAAGVYIRERRIACVIGKITQPNDKQRPDTGLFPKTSDRIHLPELGCEGIPPKNAIQMAAQMLKSRVSADGIQLGAVHIATFGGVESVSEDRKSDAPESQYGRITNASAHPGAWEGINLHVEFKSVLKEVSPNILVTVGTDADAAAYGEFLHEAQRKKESVRENYLKSGSLVCLNISRSINGGIVKGGELWSAENHPTMSSIRPPRYTIKNDTGGTWFDLYEGNCRFHGDCIEGLIGASALEERTGYDSFEDIPLDHQVWDLVAYYVAQLCITVTAVLAPEAIILIGKSIRHGEDSAFSESILKRVRGHFYARITNQTGETRPQYEAIQLKNRFIRLPAKVRTKDGLLREGRPGRHGALRLAARNYLIESNKSG